jgi:transcription-repair coupling factor (superfamily II helicase)
MVNFRSLDELEKMKDELRDRFGPVPESIIRLIDAIELKILAGKLYSSRLILNGKILKLDFAEQAKDDDHFFKDILPGLLNENKTKVRFVGDSDKLSVQIELPGTSKTDQLDFAKKLLKNVN